MHARVRRLVLVVGGLLLAGGFVRADDDEAQLQYFREHIRPILSNHCFSCHNEADRKGGLNLESYDFVVQIVRNGQLWVRVNELVSSGEMPPDTKPRLSPEEKTLLVEGINDILDEALAIPDPGQVVLRRLSNREYHYTIRDLLGVDFDARSFFPADGSGGEGFDNQARVLYLTPLMMERYFEAAEQILDRAYADPALRARLVPHPYERTLRERLAVWWHSLWYGEDISLRGPVQAAQQALYPFATRAYRRFLNDDEKDQLTTLFSKVYLDLGDTPDRFSRSILESLKFVLISPHFLYRYETDLPLDTPYPISNLELATRLSYFLWSSTPDDELLNVAYRDDLHDPDVLQAQVRRMLADPRSVRLAESFAAQWLDIDDLLDEHEVDAERFPEFSPALRQAMHRETVSFFHHVLTDRQSFLDLIDSDYTFLNQPLAAHYGIERVEGTTFRKVTLTDRRRGGVLGMGSVLTTTSLPTRTSPVLRGKWVLEQLLGTPAPPPPPDVPELEAAKAAEDELDLRELLSLHRSPSTCFACHQKMDPLGLGLENFDATGRWREAYGAGPEAPRIDASGVLASGEAFSGPAELKGLLLQQKEAFARNLARKMLSFALGRGIRFQDMRTIDQLTDSLLENNFHTVRFISEVVMSYPFRHKKSDPTETDPLQS